MILYIDTSDGEKVTVALGDKGKVVRLGSPRARRVAKRSLKAKYKQAEKLLPAIDILLKEVKEVFETCQNRFQKPIKQSVKYSKVYKTLDLSRDIDHIVVVNGPGPFTALRIGVATANALGYGLNIPVVGIRSTNFYNLGEMVKEGGRKVKKSNSLRGNWISRQTVVDPFYGQEPNITVKK